MHWLHCPISLQHFTCIIMAWWCLVVYEWYWLFPFLITHVNQGNFCVVQQTPMHVLMSNLTGRNILPFAGLFHFPAPYHWAFYGPTDRSNVNPIREHQNLFRTITLFTFKTSFFFIISTESLYFYMRFKKLQNMLSSQLFSEISLPFI